MSDVRKTVKQVLDGGERFLSGKAVENPRLACELLLSRLLGCKRLDLYLKFDSPLSEKYLDAMRRGVTRVGQGEPVQYILGQTEFMGHLIMVDRRALIPRPETEILVETVLQSEHLWKAVTDDASDRPLIVDVGTGSGCIAVALALGRQHGVYIGLDTSEEALGLARENARAHGLADRIAFAHGELADCVEPETISAIVSNPPYIPTGEYEQLPPHIRDHEPKAALEAGPRGLAIIDPLIQDAACALRDGGLLFLEVGAGQAQSVASLMTAAGFVDVVVKPDLADRDRVVHGRLGG